MTISSFFKLVEIQTTVASVVGVAVGLLPLVLLITLITIKPINANIKAFFKLQSKKDTFVLSVKSFVVFNAIYVMTLIVGYII